MENARGFAKRGWLVGLLAAALLPAPALAAVVTRGPYLQKAHPFGVTVRWRTDLATDAVVRFGSSPSSLLASASQALVTTEHEVVVGGLTAGTRYFYSVGSSAGGARGRRREHTFRTAPLPGTRRPVRIWVIGDSGTANCDGPRRARRLPAPAPAAPTPTCG